MVQSVVLSSPPWGRYDKVVVLENNDIFVITHDSRNVWQSRDGGRSWYNVTPKSDRGHWQNREDFEAVAIKDNKILVMGGSYYGHEARHVWHLITGNHYNKHY